MTSAVLTETAVRELRNMGYARICWPERDLVVALADHWLRTQAGPNDTQRLDWLAAQHGNLFTPQLTPNEKAWCWYGNDGKSRKAETLRELIDRELAPPQEPA